MNTNLKIFLGFLVIIVSIYFLLNKKKRNPYRNLDENHKLMEPFLSKTVSGRECIPWKNAVNYTEYGNSRECRNPEKDVNGSWCYTDSYGNYDYCDSFEPGCMKMKVLEGCFTPDKNGYELVIYNSQPFNKYLELDKIVDSANQIWVLDQSGRFLRNARKSKYLNFSWDNRINDSFNNYDVGIGPDQVFNITGIGVKMGGYKVKSEDGTSSLAGSEVCYLFLKNNTDLKRNRMIKCLSGEKVNIQGTKDEDYLQVEWKDNNIREYINLSKKINVTQNNTLISIHKEKMKGTKGILWGDIVFGKDNDGIFEFSSLGDTFPDSNFYSNSDTTITNDTENKYLNVSEKDFFSSGTLYFTHKMFHRLNQQIVEKSNEGMNIIFAYLNRKVEEDKLEEGEKEFLDDFRNYLKYRILINDDFKFKENDEIFTYQLKNNNGKLNDYFKEDNIFGLMEQIPVIKYKKFMENKKIQFESLTNGFDYTFLKSKLDRIDKNMKNVRKLEDLNTGSEGGEDEYCLKNLKYSTRRSSDFNSEISLENQIDGILNKIKDISLVGKNAQIKIKLNSFKTNYNNLMKEFRDNLSKSDTTKLFNEAVDYISKLSVLYNSKKTKKIDRDNYISSNFAITTNQGRTTNEYENKKLYYSIVHKLANYYKSSVKDIYNDIFLRVQTLRDYTKLYTPFLNVMLNFSRCYFEEQTDSKGEVILNKFLNNRFTRFRATSIDDITDENLTKYHEFLKNSPWGKLYSTLFPGRFDIKKKDITLYLQNDLSRGRPVWGGTLNYLLSDDDNLENNKLFKYKLTFNVETGIISEFTHVGGGDATKAQRYGLPGFYSKKIDYLSQDKFTNDARQYKIMVFDDKYKLAINPIFRADFPSNARRFWKDFILKKMFRDKSSSTAFLTSFNHWYPGAAKAYYRDLGALHLEYSRSSNDKATKINEEEINSDDLVGKNIYEISHIFQKESKYYNEYDINYHSELKHTLYRNMEYGRYGITFSRQLHPRTFIGVIPPVIRNLNTYYNNRPRIPTLYIYDDERFQNRRFQVRDAGTIPRIFQYFKMVREKYIRLIESYTVYAQNLNIYNLSVKTQEYINKDLRNIANKVADKFSEINYQLKPNPLQSIDLVDNNLKESLDNLKELQKPDIPLNESNFNNELKSCTYKDSSFKRNKKFDPILSTKKTYEIKVGPSPTSDEITEGKSPNKYTKNIDLAEEFGLGEGLIVVPKPVNYQYSFWRDTFKTEVIGKKLTVTRIDENSGWGQDLVLEAKRYIVNVGRSNSKVKIVSIPKFENASVIEPQVVSIPFNKQEPFWRDTFDAYVDSQNEKVIVTRTDQNSGWRQNLQLQLYSPSYRKTIEVGSNPSNIYTTKIPDDAPESVKVNPYPSYNNEGNFNPSFETTIVEKKLTIKRTDTQSGGWNRNLTFTFFSEFESMDRLKEVEYQGLSQEKNCFDDFVKDQVIDVDEINKILDQIVEIGKHNTYTFTLKEEDIKNGIIDEGKYTPGIDKSEFTLPLIAEFVGQLKLIISSIKRKEELIRHNSAFFYELDDLLDLENLDKGYTDAQLTHINNIIHLFFEKATIGKEIDGLKKIERKDKHMIISNDNFPTIENYLYDADRIKILLDPNILILRDESREAQEKFEETERNCGMYYKNRILLKKIERKEFFLKELQRGFYNNDERVKLPEFKNDSFKKQDNVEDIFISCGAIKRNYEKRFLINNIRDDLPILKGTFNPSNLVDNLVNQLASMDEDFEFDTELFKKKILDNYESVKNNFSKSQNILYGVLKDTNQNYTKIITYLNKNNFEVQSLLPSIRMEFDGEYNPEGLEPNFGIFDSKKITDKCKFYRKTIAFVQKKIKTIRKHIKDVSDGLITSFPNIKLLEYLSFLNDLEKYNEVDVIRKIELVEECLKIFGEINNLVNHSGLDVGVIDYNLNHEYLYVDYLFPSKPKYSNVPDNQITKYDWESSKDIIESLNLVTVRLKKEYLIDLFDKSRGKFSDVIYTSVVGNVDNPPRIAGKTINLFEKDSEGKLEKQLRSKLNIGREIFHKFKLEHQDYVILDEQNDEYEKLVKLLFFKELKEDIDRNKFIEQGRIFVKQSTNSDEKNRLQVYLKEYDLEKTDKEILGDYNKYVDSNLVSNTTNITSNNIRYFYDYSDKEDHPNLFNNGADGTAQERMIYQIDPSGFTSGSSVYGIMNYNFTNSLTSAIPKLKKKLEKVYFKKKVLFQIYGKQVNSNDIGPIDLVNKSELSYTLTPEIKYTHGIVFNPDGTIKISKSGFGILAWFFQKFKDGSFKNIDEWLPFYKTLKSEGMYFIGANPADLGFNSSRKFEILFNDYLQSLMNNKSIGRINKDTVELLKGLKLVGSNYDKEKKLEKSYPQIKLDRLMSKKYSNQVFIEAIEFKNENEPIDKKVLALVLDTEERAKNIKSDYLGSKLINQISFQDKKNGEPFKYEYYKLKMVNKLDILVNNDFCEVSGKKNKYNTLWRYKIIKNYDDYKLLVEGNDVRDEASLRIKGLYDLHDSLKDNSYYNMITTKYGNMNNITLKKTLKKILENRKKNMLEGSGYPFMVVYQVRDYEGYLCQEGIKNSQRIFLTYELGENFDFIDKGDSTPLNLIDQQKGPIISEEFLSYTGHGATIRFCFQKTRGSTPIETKGICSSNDSDYSALPGFSDDCSANAGDSCGDTMLGLTRLDGTPKCELDDNEVKTKPLGPMDVSVPGNVPKDACDIYKVKGNKRVKYKIGKMFGYNDDGKYQLNNQYTLQYGNYYFRYDAKTKAISLEEELSVDINEIASFAFNVTILQDKYGPYMLLNPHTGIKDDTGDNTEYLTRVINIFDKHFDAWKVEPKMDKSSGDKNHVRDRLKSNNNLDPKWDNQYYAQKFNLPEDILMKIANEEGIKSELIDKLKADLEKGNYLFCNLTGPQGGLCKGDFDAKPALTLDEENEILRQQATQITNLMKRFENVPQTHFTKFPENEQLMNFMKNTINEVKKASEFVYKRVQDVNWVVKTQLKTNADANKLNKSKNKKLSTTNIEEQSMGDFIDESNIMANAVKDLQKMTLDTQTQPKQCRSIEGFDNMNSPNPSPGITEKKLSKYDRNMSGRYYNYVKDEINKKKENISNLNDKIHKLLTQLNTMSDGMDLSGEKKQMLLSEMIQEKNKLNKMIFDIKNYEQQDRINRINQKLHKVEEIRGEMEEDDFMTKKPDDDKNNVSVISREDGELINMYRINKNNNPDHLLFLNGGCLQYDAEKKDISVEHCEANLLQQQFNVFRIEDRADMEKFKIKNSENGIDRPYGVVMTKDNKCLHKEDGQISVRNCDNVKNQYWDYSNITGPCNGN